MLAFVVFDMTDFIDLQRFLDTNKDVEIPDLCIILKVHEPIKHWKPDGALRNLILTNRTSVLFTKNGIEFYEKYLTDLASMKLPFKIHI